MRRELGDDDIKAANFKSTRTPNDETCWLLSGGFSDATVTGCVVDKKERERCLDVRNFETEGGRA